MERREIDCGNLFVASGSWGFVKKSVVEELETARCCTKRRFYYKEGVDVKDFMKYRQSTAENSGKGFWFEL